MKNTNIDSLEKFFNNVELYTRLDFDIYDIDKDVSHFNQDELIRFLNVLGLKGKKITSYCKECKMNFPFDYEIDGSRVYFVQSNFVGFRLTSIHNVRFSSKAFDGVDAAFPTSEIVGDFSAYFEYVFKCTNNPEHHVYKMFILIRKKKSAFSIMKIGQYPSMIDIHGFDFDGYSKQLEALNAYDDFKKAELCISDGFSAGAYTYLRRVFEKMLNKYCENINLPDNFTETKIKACKCRFDERIHPLLPRLYKILSEGIHSLDDVESKNYYDYLKIIIVMQLEFLKENDDKESQTKTLDKKLNEIISKIEAK